MQRRLFLVSPLALLGADAGAVDYAPVLRKTPLAFPRDHGSHPQFRTEWWYLTGAVGEAGAHDYGIQITFFRNRPGVAEGNASAFAPQQLLFAHAAIGEARHARLRHDQRAARSGFGLADAATETTHVWIDDWSLRLDGNVYRARIAARDFAFDLQFTATQPVLLQGDEGFSRKGPLPSQASYYYSLPQLRVGGVMELDRRKHNVEGTAWLDHEWSSEYLAPDATGWDWTGINFDDGSALTAFRIRRADGTALWAGGTLRDASMQTRHLAPPAITFSAVRRWRSPRTSVEYPVAMIVRAGDEEWRLDPLMDDQELDSRASTGTIYWEGLVGASRDGRSVGRGFLELTGYWRPLRL